MKYISIVLFFLSVGFVSKAQPIEKELLSQAQYDSLFDIEIQLDGLSYYMINDTEEQVRQTTTFFFVKTLIKGLRINNSFFYPFDSVKAVSIQKPEDNNFRIFTWHLRLKNGSYQQYGVLQFNPEYIKSFKKKKKKGAKLPNYIPLIDRSDSLLTINNFEQSSLSNEQWFGALYYKIITAKYKKQTYYILLGLDMADSTCNRKIAEVLTIDKNGNIQFGAPLFKKLNNDQMFNRFILSYANDANIILRYTDTGDGKNKIVFDNLISGNNPIQGKNNMIPDGSYDALKWEKGLWIQEEILNVDGVKTIGVPGKVK